MIINDEILNAYLDGELTVDEIAEVARQIEASPELSKQIETMRQNDTSFAHSFHEIDSKAMPDNIMAMLDKFPAEQAAKSTDTESNVVSFGTKPSVKTQAPFWQMAMAASIALFIGFGAGSGLAPSTTPQQVNGADLILAQLTSGMIGQDNMLYKVLEHQPSAIPVFLIARSNDTMVIPSMTFQTAEGGFCREYRVLTSKTSTQNVACRREDAWIVKISVGIENTIPTEEGLYQTASHMDNALITSMIQGLIIGDPLSTDNETIIMENDWQEK